MKKRIYQHFHLIAILLLSFILFTGCSEKKSAQKENIIVIHEFPATNWTFEEQVIKMKFDITDTTRPYRIEYYVTYDTSLNTLSEVPVNISLTAPDGMETFVSSKLHFDRNINKNITPTGNGSIYSLKLIAFPSKRLSQKGQYSATFYRKSNKYDNYGFHKLTLQVVPLSKE